jgi:hypothetical protein
MAIVRISELALYNRVSQYLFSGVAVYKLYSLIILSLLCLAACGGGSGTTATSNPVTVNASAAQTVTTGAPVTFTGSAASSAGAISSMGWQLQVLTLSGNWPAAIGNANCATTTTDSSGNTNCAVQITPPKTLAADTTYILTLTAVDAKGNTNSTTTTLVVSQSASQTANPTATVGANTSVVSATNVALTCSGSGGTPGSGGTYAYQWTVSNANGLSINLVNPNTATASFSAPVVQTATTVQLQCLVTDSNQKTGSATQSITITPVVLPTPIPVSSSGGNVAPGAVSNLDGSSSYLIDANGNKVAGSLYFLWTVPASSGLTIINPTSSVASVAFPSLVLTPTTYVFTLNVSNAPINADGSTSGTLKSVNVAYYLSALPALSLSVSNPAQLVASGQPVTFNATVSGNTSGNQVYYAWTETDTSTPTIANLNGNNSSVLGFIAPTVTSTTVYTFRVSVGYQPITTTNPGTASVTVSLTVTP